MFNSNCDTSQNSMYDEKSGRFPLYSLGSSPLMLLAAIALTIAVVLGFVSALNVDPSEALSNTFDKLGGDFAEEFGKVDLSATPVSRTISAIITSVFPVLCCISVWLIYMNSKKEGTSTSGLTILKVIFIIAIVGMSLLGGLLLLCGVMLLIFGESIISNAVQFGYDIGGIAEGFEEKEFSGFAVSLAAVFIIVFAVALMTAFILYYARLISTVNTVKYTLMTGEPKLKGISSYVGVVCCFFAVSTLFSILGSVGNAAMTDHAPLTLVLDFANDTAQAVAYLCFGILIFKYRREMKGL